MTNKLKEIINELTTIESKLNDRQYEELELMIDQLYSAIKIYQCSFKLGNYDISIHQDSTQEQLQIILDIVKKFPNINKYYLNYIIDYIYKMDEYTEKEIEYLHIAAYINSGYHVFDHVMDCLKNETIDNNRLQNFINMGVSGDIISGIVYFIDIYDIDDNTILQLISNEKQWALFSDYMFIAFDYDDKVFYKLVEFALQLKLVSIDDIDLLENLNSTDFLSVISGETTLDKIIV